MPTTKPTRSSQSVIEANLVISVASGVGHGSTKLAAFDAALRTAGVANFNLLRLSSIIPPHSVIRRSEPGDPTVPAGGWGDRLYVVMAECRVDTPHEEAWAGVGWVQDDTSGRGLFVEHEGHSKGQVEADIQSSLEDLMHGRPEIRFGPMDWMIDGGTCTDEPLCAMVVAAFAAETWQLPSTITLP